MRDEDIIEQERVKEAVKLIGRYSRYIMRELKPEMENALETTMMVKTPRAKKIFRNGKERIDASNRLNHYANTGLIAKKITAGLEGNDKDYCEGVRVIALLHDLQGPYGHDGEFASGEASKQNNGGPMLHNINAMMRIIYRLSDRIKNAICLGMIVQEESVKRNTSQEELYKRVKNGKEPEIIKKISDKRKEYKEILNKSIEVISEAAGNHNGERSGSNIVPDYTRRFKDVYGLARMTYIDKKYDYQMVSCNIVDAIVKMADQISSIAFDIIDAKRAGIESTIPEEWAEPISKILGTTEEEAKIRLKADNSKTLYKLVREIQEKIINEVIENSKPENGKASEIHMGDIAQYVYGRSDEAGNTVVNGIRTFNSTKHHPFTSDNVDWALVNNMFSGLTEFLSKAILEEDGTFPTDLNELFRLSPTNSMRSIKEKKVVQRLNKDKNLEDFYLYVSELASGEYELNKWIVKKREVAYYRRIIEETLKKRTLLLDYTEPRSEIGSSRYLVEQYFCSPEYEAMKPDENGKYSDEEIKGMLDRINAFLKVSPIAGKKHLPVITHKETYIVEGNERKGKFVRDVELNTDEQIAARIAINYLNTLNDRKLINLAHSLGVITDEQKRYLNRPYNTDMEKSEDNELLAETRKSYTNGVEK